MIERVAGQLATEPAIVFLQESAQHRAAQRAAGTLLKLSLFVCRRFVCARAVPAGQGALDEVPLHAPGAQKYIDLLQALA